MARGISNWTYKEVIEFLKENGFSYLESRKGSHEAWLCVKTNAIVEVNFHGNNHTYPERTLETMIRQSQIDKKTWRKWAVQ